MRPNMSPKAEMLMESDDLPELHDFFNVHTTVKLDFKELLNKEQIDFKELFTDYQLFYTINLLLNKELLPI